MYYVEAYLHVWMIKKQHDDYLSFGPFESQADAWFVCEMLNNDKIRFGVGTGYDKEAIEKSYSIHKHII